MPEKERNKGLAGYDRTHNFQAYGAWDLPFGKGQRWAQDGSRAPLLWRLADQRHPQHHERDADLHRPEHRRST